MTADGTVGAIDNSGAGTKKVDTSELVVGSNTVERQRIVIADATNPAGLGNVSQDGSLWVKAQPHTLLIDPFIAIDTTNTWNAGVSSGGGAAPAITSGALTLGTGTTTAGYSYINSQPSFTPKAGAYLRMAATVSIEFAVTAQTYRFWGFGVVGSPPTVSIPMTNGVGFEVTTAGVFACVVYYNSTRVQIGTATIGDANFHDYQVYLGARTIEWYVDDVFICQSPSALAANATVSSVPILFVAVAGTSPSPSGTLTCGGTSLGNTGGDHSQIADATYPWRQAAVVAKGTQGTYAVQAQDMKDTGRTPISFNIDDAANVVAEGMRTMAVIKGTVSSSSASYPVTAGKTLRITSMTVMIRATGATIGTVRARLRYSTGTVATTDALACNLIASTPATSGSANWANMPFPDGYEIPAGYTVGISTVGGATTSNMTVTVTGFEY